jgi:hypothetical protein
MYTKPQRLISKIENLGNYVEGFDIYNSKFLSMILDPKIERVDFTIQTSQFRPDLIAKRFYGDESYMGLVIVQSRKSLNEFTEGTTIQLIPKNKLEELLRKVEN